MLRVGLEFAPNTSRDCKLLIGRLTDPTALLTAYRNAKMLCGTSDIVLVMSDQSPDILGYSRAEYSAHLVRVLGRRATEFTLYGESAQKHLKLPIESEATWIVINVQSVLLPVICAIYATPYMTEAVSEAN